MGTMSRGCGDGGGAAGTMSGRCGDGGAAGRMSGGCGDGGAAGRRAGPAALSFLSADRRRVLMVRFGYPVNREIV